MKNNNQLAAYKHFLNTSIDEHFQAPDSSPDTRSRFDLFRDTAESVPAYRQFLSEHSIDPGSISSAADLQRLPAVNRENYISRHPIPDLCRNGRLEQCDMIAVSSGSTGKPTFWPRTFADELSIAWRFEQVFHDSFCAHERSTLAVVCFSLGTWVGGMFTAACCRRLAEKGYPITVVTPGNNREEIFRVVQDLAPHFDQTVLLGYPPFLKDVIDTGSNRGVSWTEYNIKLVTAGEVFSEEWRSLVAERVASKDICFDSASLYGTADAGVLGNETPLSICIRRFLSRQPDVARQLFGESRLPTLVQYDPRYRYFEIEDSNLLFTGDNGIPLIRYNILDTGGIVEFDKMLGFCRASGFDPIEGLKRELSGDDNVNRVNVRSLPFVFVFGRSNFTVSYFGANIYPENITVGLEQAGIKEWVTGKFVMEVLEDEEHNPHLTVTIELAPGVIEDDVKRSAAAFSIQTQLTRLNSEFVHYTPLQYQSLHVFLKPSGDPDNFPVGVKHRYTRSR